MFEFLGLKRDLGIIKDSANVQIDNGRKFPKPTQRYNFSSYEMVKVHQSVQPNQVYIKTL